MEKCDCKLDFNRCLQDIGVVAKDGMIFDKIMKDIEHVGRDTKHVQKALIVLWALCKLKSQMEISLFENGNTWSEVSGVVNSTKHDKISKEMLDNLLSFCVDRNELHVPDKSKEEIIFSNLLVIC